MAPDASPAPPVLPRGRHAAPRHVVEESQRDRLVVAIVAAVAEKGYVATAVADVIERAGVSRKSFYEHFANKEACFLHAYDTGVDLVLAEIEAAVASETDPFAAAAASVTAYLDALEDHPEFARTFLIEVLAAGPRALARRAAVHERFAQLIRERYAVARRSLPGLEEPADHRVGAVVGATDALVMEHIRTNGPAGLRALAPAVLDVQLGLLVGDALRPAGS